MSISSIMHADEEDYSHIKEEDMLDFEDESNSGHSPIKRRRRDSTNGFRPAGGTRSSVDTTDSVSTTHTSPQSIPCIHPVTTLRPLAHVLPHHETANDSILAESLIQVTREKEAGRMKRAQDMLQFLREKRLERDQLLIEKERTKRVKARAELVRNLLDAGFDKEAIAEQLNNL